MYHTFDASAIESLVGITAADRPSGVILHGVYEMPKHVQVFRDRLANARVADHAFNVVIGEHEGRTIWYAPVLGAPLAAFVTHAAAVLGAQRIVLIGSFGGTRRGMDIGDLLLPTAAGRGDGASDWYLAPGEEARANETLVQRLRQMLQERQLTWQEGPVFTTPAFMAETREDVSRWEAEGYAGVEMETATVYAIAQHFEVPAVALLYLLDNLIEERHILDNSETERARLAARKALVQEIALELMEI